MHLIAVDERGEVEGSGILIPAEIAAVFAQTKALYARAGYKRPWISYVAVEDGACVGLCAFKSAPSEGRTEIAYMTLPEHEGKGVATRMASELIRIARAELPDIDVRAQTLREVNASVAVLKKLGFKRAGEIVHPEDGPVWEWRLAPAT